MPAIIVGADTPVGAEIVATLTTGNGEIRVFVTDPDRAEEFRRAGCKVAIGDVSDESHVGLAAFGCFTAVLITEAADDNRERSFADTSATVLEGWREATNEAGIQRQIWVGSPKLNDLSTSGSEVAVISRDEPDLAGLVARLNEMEKIPDQLNGTS